MEAVSSRERKNCLRELSLGDPPGAGGAASCGEGRPLPGARRRGLAGPRPLLRLFRPQLPSLSDEVAGFKGLSTGDILRVPSCHL